MVCELKDVIFGQASHGCLNITCLLQESMMSQLEGWYFGYRIPQGSKLSKNSNEQITHIDNFIYLLTYYYIHVHSYEYAVSGKHYRYLNSK